MKRWFEDKANAIRLEFLYHRKFFFNERIHKKQKLKHLIFQVICRRCEGGHMECEGGFAYLKHSNCAYVDEISNYNFCCEKCHESIDAMYQEMWDDYNSSRY